MVLRFALGGISCECNGFAAGETETEYFRQTGFVLVHANHPPLAHAQPELEPSLTSAPGERGGEAGQGGGRGGCAGI